MLFEEISRPFHAGIDGPRNAFAQWPKEEGESHWLIGAQAESVRVSVRRTARVAVDPANERRL
jgi:hypothetical protein